MEIYVFDGSLEGLLTAIFDCYSRKSGPIKLVSSVHYHPDAFQSGYMVMTNSAKANRVWNGLKQKLNAQWMHAIYAGVLSEQPQTFQALIDFARYIIDHPNGASENYGNPSVLAVSQMERKVHREKHRMEAFIRFQETGDGIFYAHIEPDYNVLPLISRHFEKRYANQKWIIFDLKRKYGLYYDLDQVSEIGIEFTEQMSPAVNTLPAELRDPKEELYSLLWKDYFRNTNIPARKNMKLHIQHVPKRYWKYLSEKQP